MHSEESSVYHLLEFAHDGVVYQIPEYQRGYVWADDEGMRYANVRNLWEDIESSILSPNGPVDGRAPQHFFGSLILHNPPAHGQPSNVYHVVDGQQRLVTFALLWLAIRDLLRTEAGPENLAVADRIHQALFKQSAPKLLLKSARSDNEVFTTILQAWPIGNKHAAHPLYRSYSELREKIARHLGSGRFTAAQLYERLNLGTRVILVLLNTDDNPHLAFEVLNTRGRTLSIVDMSRNGVLSLLPVADRASFQESFWKPIEEDFKDHPDELEAFIRYFGKRNGESAASSDSYDEFRADIHAAFKARRLDQFMAEMRYAAELYCYILDPLTRTRSKKREIKAPIEDISRLHVPSAYPFLLLLLHHLENDLLPEEIAGHLLDAFRSTVLRIIIDTQRPASQVGALAATLCASNQDNYNRRLDPHRLLRKMVDACPRDDKKFQTTFLSRQMYGSIQSARTRIIFEIIERNQYKTFDIRFNAQESQIEHVMPRALTDAWITAIRDGKRTSETEVRAQHKRWVNTLGNLTVLTNAANLAGSNKSFKDKQEKVFSEDRAQLNSYLKNVQSWNIDKIKTRGAKLVGLCLQEYWKHPATYLEQYPSPLDAEDDIAPVEPEPLDLEIEDEASVSS